mmetsp:Transcript_40905/g.94739  ORF Transcript_40905/g.94739 Transcript_40905/m.94739 type:complete len:301 (-) Transcript_40905:51-953(-)
MAESLARTLCPRATILFCTLASLGNVGALATQPSRMNLSHDFSKIHSVGRETQPRLSLSRRDVSTLVTLGAAAIAVPRPSFGLDVRSGDSGSDAARSFDAYDAYAPSYDALDGGQAATRLGFDELRRSAIARARGDVLEVGVGTGLNLPLYDWSGVRSLVALDASQGMLSEARKRVLDLGVASKVHLRQGDAASLQFADGTFDAVLDTYSLCVFADPETALREMRRVLKPKGIIICVEHQRASGLLGAYQDATAPLVTPMSKGCVWNQDVRAIARKVGCREVSAESSVFGTIVTLILSKN